MIKTISEYSIEQFDERVNEFCESNDVFATQTHVTKDSDDIFLFTAVLFVRSKPQV